MISFGTALKDVRNALGLSQAEAASRIGTTQRHLSFLETGRSMPGRTMLARMATEWPLSHGQRAMLYEASGFASPIRRRGRSDVEVAATLDMMQHHVLANWPFPGFVLDAGWNVLRMNGPGRAMLMTLTGAADGFNMFEVFLSPQVRAMITNWDKAASTIYFRIQKAAEHSPTLAELFKCARDEGVFDDVMTGFGGLEEIPIYVPIEMALPGGVALRASSLLGQLASVHDALIEGFEIELMVPADAETEAHLREMFKG